MKKRCFLLLICLWILSSYASVSQNYENNMKILINLARSENPKYPFAAMIIDNKTGSVLCTGVNQSKKNPTWHGEIVAIDNCANKYGEKMDWKNSTLLTTAEPCPMCMSAIIWAGISTVVYGTSIQYLSEHNWNQIHIDSHHVAEQADFSPVKIVSGVLADQTNPLFQADD